MPTSSLLKAAGLQTFANYLSEVPEGSLTEANNVNIDRNGILEPRRGNKQLATLATPPSQLLNYKDRILCHIGSTLNFQQNIDGNTFIDFTGTIDEVDPNLRIKGVEQNGNLYITSKTGIKKVASLDASMMTDAGGIPAFDLDVSLDMTSSVGFLAPLDTNTTQVEVAYRVTWGTNDVNENFIEGTPSSRAVIQNTTGSSKNTTIVFTVPTEITTDYFFRLYRTSVAGLNGSGDEMRLVFEGAFNTSATIANDGYLYSSGEITVPDNVPNTIRDIGSPLYTNQFSGEGILQTNDAPPVSKDLALFKNSMFYANTRTKHKIDEVLTGLDGIETLNIPVFNTTSGNAISLLDSRTVVVTNDPNTVGYAIGTVTSIAGLYKDELTDVGDNFIRSLEDSTTVILADGSASIPAFSTITVLFGPSSITHTLSPGDKVALTGTNPNIDGIYTINTASPTSISFVETIANGTKIRQISKSYLTINKTSPKIYYPVGQQETWSLNFLSEFNLSNLSGDTALTNFYYSISSVDNKIDYYFRRNSKLRAALDSTTLFIGSTNKITISGLVGTSSNFVGLINDDIIQFDDTSIGLPLQLKTNTDYYVKNIGAGPTFSNFEISLTSGGTSIDFDNGTSGITYITRQARLIPDPQLPNRIGIEIDTNDWTVSSPRTYIFDKIKEALEATGDFNVSLGSEYGLNVTPGNELLLISTTNNGNVNNTGTNFDLSLVKLLDGFGEDSTKGFFRLSGLPSPAQRIEDTTKSLVKVINKTTGTEVKALYTSTSTDLPGKFSLESKLVDNIPITIQTNNSSFGSMFSPNLTTLTNSTSNTYLNKIYFSKSNQPEAVPLVNNLTVGPKDKAILRIIPLRDSLFILKEEAIYRLTGFDPTSYSVTVFDNSSNIVAPDTAVVLANQIYMLTTQGVASVSETGTGIISRPIENIINQLTAPAFTDYSTISFGVSYETDRSYLLFVPSLSTDTYATKCYRYNTFTQTWTSWDGRHQCGLVETHKNKLYLGAADIPVVEQERKTLTLRDYADREYSRTIVSATNGSLVLDSVTNIRNNDSLSQTQYLTPLTYNTLITKIKNDPNMIGNPNLSLLSLITTPGQNLPTYITSLVTFLNIVDTGYTYNNSSSFSSIQTQFNVIVNRMNRGPSPFGFKTYGLSSGTSIVDIPLDIVVSLTNTVTTSSSKLYLLGETSHFEAIQSSIIWSPSALGDATIGKHIRQGTFLIEFNDLLRCDVSYSTDLSGDFETIPFLLDELGINTSYPLRTLIPQQKQRCRNIKAKFHHSTAFYKFSILGISFTFEPTSDRFYR